MSTDRREANTILKPWVSDTVSQAKRRVFVWCGSSEPQPEYRQSVAQRRLLIDDDIRMAPGYHPGGADRPNGDVGITRVVVLCTPV